MTVAELPSHRLLRRRSVLSACAATLCPALLGCRVEAPAHAPCSPAAELPAPFPTNTFPLQRKVGRRHLVDASGRPFLLHGDTAWSLLVQLTRSEAEEYLRDRKGRGFNAVLVNLLEQKYAVDRPRNRNGDPPFAVAGDFSQPVDAYFDHAVDIVKIANDLGMLVLLAPSYIGCCGSDGWYREMKLAGIDRLARYGTYLGNRFRSLQNILWTHGGDGNPENADFVVAIARAIRNAHPTTLHTAHTGPGHEALEIYDSADWIDVNNIYTYDPVGPLALRAYSRQGPVPYFLIESEYEGENRRAPDVRIRAQAWQAILCGAAGQIVGNNPIWHFASPYPITPFQGGWRDHLNSEAARSMTALRRVLEAIEWWDLTPDDGQFLVDGKCEGHYGTWAALLPGRSMALLYAPRGYQFELNLSRILAGDGFLHWIDPVDGRPHSSRGIEPSNGRRTRLLPPTLRNSGGDRDWIGLLSAEPKPPASLSCDASDSKISLLV